LQLILRSHEGDKNIELQKRDFELNETKKQLVKVELQAQKRSQQILESKKELATLQLKMEELETAKSGHREKEKRMARDLAVLQEELNRRDAKITKLDSERLRNEELLGTADVRYGEDLGRNSFLVYLRRKPGNISKCSLNWLHFYSL
jgi:chromosome segregation ATPase